jgi:hypothetical protein
VINHFSETIQSQRAGPASLTHGTRLPEHAKRCAPPDSLSLSHTGPTCQATPLPQSIAPAGSTPPPQIPLAAAPAGCSHRPPVLLHAAVHAHTMGHPIALMCRCVTAPAAALACTRCRYATAAPRCPLPLCRCSAAMPTAAKLLQRRDAQDKRSPTRRLQHVVAGCRLPRVCRDVSSCPCRPPAPMPLAARTLSRDHFYAASRCCPLGQQRLDKAVQRHIRATPSLLIGHRASATAQRACACRDAIATVAPSTDSHAAPRCPHASAATKGLPPCILSDPLPLVQPLTAAFSSSKPPCRMPPLF